MTNAATPSPGVLLVDDDSSVLFLLYTIFRDQGLTVWAAPGGEAAVKIYRRHHESIGAVLLDVRMPGMDGPETLAALREINPNVRACFASGDMGRYTEADLLRMGAALVLQKPFPIAEVARTLARLAASEGTPAT
jgi:CheY-like chemotaxis protein